MDINLFLKSLSPMEIKQLRDALLNENRHKITTKEFIHKHKVSGRLYNILEENWKSGEIFEYVSDINKDRFLRLKNAGTTTWNELSELIIKHHG